jgi:hypothetical protein
MLQAEIVPSEAGVQIAVTHTDFIELYMLKQDGQGDGRIFIKGGILKLKEFKQLGT